MKNLKIGTRLGLSFFVILSLLGIITVIGIVHLQSIGQLADQMVNVGLAKERTVNEFYRSIELNVGRIVAAAKNADPAQQKFYKDEITATIGYNSELMKAMDAAIQDEQGKALLAEISEKRKEIIATNGAVFKEKDAGNESAAREMVDNKLMPQSQSYLASIKKLAELQRAQINSEAEQIVANFNDAQNLMMFFGLLAIITGILLAIWITRSITRPLTHAVEVAGHVANGDLTTEIDISAQDETGQLMQALKNMNDNLVNIVGQVRNGAHTIALASGDIAQGSSDLTTRAGEQAGALEETASAMEELTSTVRQNADNAKQASLLALSASDIATQGGKVVGQVVNTMGSIHASSSKIVDIISVIDSIAFQTNILALNAAVEAARAGEQGRGFAVVATEVRNLAQRSASAAREIKILIDDSVKQVDTGSKLVAQAGMTMNQVVESVKRVTDVVADISSASEEQSVGIEQVNQAIVQMDESTQRNAAIVEQAAQAAMSLQEQAEKLSDMLGSFKLHENNTPANRNKPLKLIQPQSAAQFSNRQYLANRPEANARLTGKVVNDRSENF